MYKINENRKVYGYLDLEIISIIEQQGAKTTFQLLKEFQDNYIDPPDANKIRRALRKLYIKDKLDRVELNKILSPIKPLKIKTTHYLLYFKPTEPPEWLKDYYEQLENSDKLIKEQKENIL